MLRYKKRRAVPYSARFLSRAQVHFTVFEWIKALSSLLEFAEVFPKTLFRFVKSARQKQKLRRNSAALAVNM